MEQIQERKKRIEILLVLLVVGGILWYVKFGGTEPVSAPLPDAPPSVVAAPQPPLITGPNPEAFGSFVVPDDDIVRREVTCADTLYTTLVFRIGVDYRRSPREAVYNSANPCVKGETVEVVFTPSSLGISAGKYYLVVADQGAAGSWYNAR